jgi:hypothetical protein
MKSLPLLDSRAPPVRVMALHALACCHRLFYLEEVEEIRVADDRVFAGRELHASLAADEDGEALSLELESHTLGVMDKVDCIRRRDGTHIPYEHKRGKPARDEDGDAEAWPSDRLQLSCARYIECNPVKAGLVALPWDYEWSSCRAYTLGVPDTLVSSIVWYRDLAADDKTSQRRRREFLLGDDPNEGIVRRADLVLRSDGYRRRLEMPQARFVPRLQRWPRKTPRGQERDFPQFYEARGDK